VLLHPGDSVAIVQRMPEHVSPEQARLDAQTRAIIAAREALIAAKIPHDFVGTNVTIVAPRNAPHAGAAVTIGAVTPERVSDVLLRAGLHVWSESSSPWRICVSVAPAVIEDHTDEPDAGDDEPVVDVGEGSAEPLLGGEVSEPVIPTRIPDVEVAFVAGPETVDGEAALLMHVVVNGRFVLTEPVCDHAPLDVVRRSERRVALREPGPMGGSLDGEVVVRLSRDQARHAEGACLGAAASWRSSARAIEGRDALSPDAVEVHGFADRLVEAAEALGRAIVERDGDA
jgi:hypothetical protein